jgi:hypothetical protein
MHFKCQKSEQKFPGLHQRMFTHKFLLEKVHFCLFTQAIKICFLTKNFVSKYKYLDVHQDIYSRISRHFKIWFLRSRCITYRPSGQKRKPIWVESVVLAAERPGARYPVRYYRLRDLVLSEWRRKYGLIYLHINSDCIRFEHVRQGTRNKETAGARA